MRIASAGQPAPILLRSDAVGAVPIDGVPIGIDRTARYGETHERLLTDDLLLLFTDGLLKANKLPSDAERFLMRELASGAPAAGIIEAMLSHGTCDDATALVVRKTV